MLTISGDAAADWLQHEPGGRGEPPPYNRSSPGFSHPSETIQVIQRIMSDRCFVLHPRRTLQPWYREMKRGQLYNLLAPPDSLPISQYSAGQHCHLRSFDPHSDYAVTFLEQSIS
jgi:hypothetical protein